MFDPLGFIAPYTIKAKLLLQDKLCREKLRLHKLIYEPEKMQWSRWLVGTGFGTFLTTPGPPLQAPYHIRLPISGPSIASPSISNPPFQAPYHIRPPTTGPHSLIKPPILGVTFWVPTINTRPHVNNCNKANNKNTNDDDDDDDNNNNNNNNNKILMTYLAK